MKHLLYTFAIATIIIGCGSTNTNKKDFGDKQFSDTVRIANDSLEYEILIIEPGFNAWLFTQPPRGFYGLQTLEIRNRFSVAEYNRRVIDPRYNRTGLYEQRINYESQISYGYEVNYMLYNYFEFFEERFNQRLR